MRVLLINPWESDQLPPPAIGYLQAALKYWKVDVIARDLQDAMLLDDNFDLVAVSFHSFSVKYAKMIRDKFRGRLICGGHHPSALPEQMLSIGYDQVVIGEGENAIIDIVQGNESKIIRECPVYIYGINELPFPDYTGLHFSGPLGINIITSRGCPYSCSFCGSSNFWGHRYSVRDAENVIIEIEKIKSKGFDTWIFHDDNFAANKKRVFDICAALDGSMLWACQARAESLDEELCQELYKAGCRKILLGIESLSQDVLDRCGKKTTTEKMVEGINNAHKAGIETLCLFIVGLPGDTINDVIETNRVRMANGIMNIGVNITWVLPGTDIHRRAKEQGFDDNVYLVSEAPFYTCEQTIETLNQWREMI